MVAGSGYERGVDSRPRLWWVNSLGVDLEDERDGIGRVCERETEMGRGREAIREGASEFI